MQVHILASGSSGNAIFFQMGSTKVLIDAGISAKRIELGLASVGVRAEELDAILITHEHSDHVKGIDVLVRRHQIPVFARPKTWEQISCQEKLPSACVKYLEDDLELNNLYIKPFPISHDAVDPVGFTLFSGNFKGVVATDLGLVDEAVSDALEMADIAILEANHDVQMLRNGAYPTFLKERILGNRGHLSNIEAGKLLANIKKKPNMQVFLAHLSRENNLPSLAYNTVTDILTQAGYELGTDIELRCASSYKVCSYIA
ncbi:MAG: MBL fold metallo-hydrolase [Syntrophomonadaceae bacterium]|nr:MBL fold metallo-hydrolase [Syntrophomonadaceae bacterium]